MFNNAVLDIAIGLIFVYLLYSLLATTINEFVAMIFAYRHRMLEKGIEQMLDGKNYSYYWWDKVVNIAKWLFSKTKGSADDTDSANPEKSKSIGGIMKSFQKAVPLNKYMTNVPVDAAEVNRSKAENKLYRVDAGAKRAKLDKKASLFAFKITNHPLYRRKSEQSLLFKKPAYLSASAFSDILMDVLSGKKSMKGRTPVLMTDIKNFVDNEIEENKDLKDILHIYIEQANGDVQRFKSLLEDWYDDTMERVSGWYKRQSTKILFLIGLMLAFMFNVSTIEIVRELSVNKDLREAMAQSAATYVRRPPNNPSAPKGNTDSADFVNKIKDIKAFYNDSIGPVNKMMGMGWKGSKQFFDNIISHPLNIIGFFITALAVTLGAPFWFDLLNKFVNIRAGGNDPTEKKDKATASKATALNQKPKPNSFG